MADVVLTREAGKNGDLARRLRDRSLSTLEVPLVETGPGPDRCRHGEIQGRSLYNMHLRQPLNSLQGVLVGTFRHRQNQTSCGLIGSTEITSHLAKFVWLLTCYAVR